MFKTINKVLVIGAISLSLVAAAYAHSDDELAKIKAPHNGQLRMAGAYHVELVMLADEMDIYVTDHAGQAKSTENMHAQALLLSSAGKTKLQLNAAGDNKFSVKTDVAHEAGLQIVLQLTDRTDTTVQAKFTPFKSNK